MTPDEWLRVKRLVSDALAQPTSERATYLTEHSPDEATRLEAESLLDAVLDSADLFDEPVLLIDGEAAAFDVFEFMPSALGELVFRQPVDVGDDGDFTGTDRYEVRRRIGAGGMGVVYEVEDRARRQIVALKTLRRWNAADIYRLKREFRSLTGIAHPNLVSLHDLVVDGAQCFFTMELVDGMTFVEYVRERGSADVDRARRALAQLVDGIEELHRHGQLHRDIKPSNVLVTSDGRVVILDFGLTSAVVLGDSTGASGPIGTPAYVSPERCRGLEMTPASDWYGVGATLYHALTGRPPFDGSVLDVIEQKTTLDPPAPARVVQGIPDDLNDTCMALLRRHPADRLSGLAAMEHLVAAVHSSNTKTPSTGPAPFVGRQREMALLRSAFADVRAGRTVPVYLHGPSGIGKSALVQRFFEQCSRDVPILALRSRCHEHESVPYKGLDGIIDALSRHITALAPAEAASLMPRDAHALARLFPVMQIEQVTAAPALERESDDPVALRRRAFVALRELLGRLASRQTIVLEIDDFHWADADSAASLTELLRAPDPPPLLLIVSFRTEEIETKPFLRALVDQVKSGTHLVMPLAPLSGEEVAQLIDRLLVSRESDADARRGIALEAGGNPYLVEELARYLALGTGTRPGATLGHMLTQRMETLPPESRRFLEVLAVCGRPILATRIFEACGLSGDERPLVARLRVAHFVRSSRTTDHVETYHDRVRETLASSLSADAMRRIHEVMAAILARYGDDDPEALFEHCRGAGQETLAAEHAAAAAIRASQVLAFDRAATFYRQALALNPESDVRAHWQIGLATSLENAGRPAEAADAYLDAAALTTGMPRIEWQRKAAEQLLMGGHIDRGLAIIHTVLPAVGMRLARGPRTAVASMLLRRAELSWRGLDFESRDQSQVSDEDLLRIDTCWAVSTGLMLVDTLRAASFHAGHLRMALDVGEPYRIARALALEASFSAAGGGQSGIRRSNAFAARASAAAEQIRHPHLVALSSVTAGIAAFVVGEWAKATELCERALTILREPCAGVVWELTLAQNFFLGSLMYRGQMRRAVQALPPLLEAARERGNLYFETEISTRMGLAWLAMADPVACERHASDAIARWSDSGFHRQHYNYLIARIQVALYQGRAQDAWTLLNTHLPAVRRNLWLHVHFMRIEVAFVRARCALEMAVLGHDVAAMRATATRDARLLEREHTQWSMPLSLLVRGALAYSDGDIASATRHLTHAVEAFDRADMCLYAAAARRRLAAITGGDRADLLRRESDSYMAAEDIRNPASMTRLLAPGFPDCP
jgi:tetratricopeptide (TPR) repeat protein/predicted Ser/Thr protein kinase